MLRLISVELCKAATVYLHWRHYLLVQGSFCFLVRLDAFSEHFDLVAYFVCAELEWGINLVASYPNRSSWFNWADLITDWRHRI